MKWTYYLLSLGCLLLLTLIPSRTKAVPTPEKLNTFIREVSEGCEIETPLLTIVSPCPIPKPWPMPMPCPPGNPKPTPL